MERHQTPFLQPKPSTNQLSTSDPSMAFTCHKQVLRFFLQPHKYKPSPSSFSYCPLSPSLSLALCQWIIHKQALPSSIFIFSVSNAHAHFAWITNSVVTGETDWASEGKRMTLCAHTCVLFLARRFIINTQRLHFIHFMTDNGQQ